MTRKRVGVAVETWNVLRPVFLSVVAMGSAAMAMSLAGWEAGAVISAAGFFAIGGLMLLQVYRATNCLKAESQSTTTEANKAEEHYIEVLWRIVRFSEARDKYTKGHSERVAAMSEKVARQLGLPEDICIKLNTAGRLHDLGMLAIPASIIEQRNKMSVDGFRTVKKHPIASYEILKPLKSLQPVLAAVRHHHERMNGTGYPNGLAGETIPIEACILAVADAYDAMTHDRPYRAAVSAYAAMKELERCSPAGYDPKCVEALAEVVSLPNLQLAMASA